MLYECLVNNFSHPTDNQSDLTYNSQKFVDRAMLRYNPFYGKLGIGTNIYIIIEATKNMQLYRARG